MPDIPQLQEQTQYDVRAPFEIANVGRADEMGNAIARAGQAVTNAAMSFSEIRERKDSTQRILDNAEAEEKFRAAAEKARVIARQRADVSGKDFNEIAKSIYDEETSDIPNNYGGQTKQQVSTTRMKIWNNYATHINEDAMKMSYAHMENQQKDYLHSAEQNVSTDPYEIENSIKKSFDIVYKTSALGFKNSDEQANTFKSSASRMVESGLETLIQQNKFQEAEEYLDKYGRKYFRDPKEVQHYYDRIQITQGRVTDRIIQQMNLKEKQDKKKLEEGYDNKASELFKSALDAYNEGDLIAVKIMNQEARAKGEIDRERYNEIEGFIKDRKPEKFNDDAERFGFIERITEPGSNLVKIRSDVISAVMPKTGMAPTLNHDTASALLDKISVMMKTRERKNSLPSWVERNIRMKLSTTFQRPSDFSGKEWDKTLRVQHNEAHTKIYRAINKNPTKDPIAIADNILQNWNKRTPFPVVDSTYIPFKYQGDLKSLQKGIKEFKEKKARGMYPKMSKDQETDLYESIYIQQQWIRANPGARPESIFPGENQ